MNFKRPFLLALFCCSGFSICGFNLSNAFLKRPSPVLAELTSWKILVLCQRSGFFGSHTSMCLCLHSLVLLHFPVHFILQEIQTTCIWIEVVPKPQLTYGFRISSQVVGGEDRTVPHPDRHTHTRTRELTR